ncbi:MAG: hypothetical protein RLZZ54_2101 [Cyanobacteriota bacterium]|jgi:hypothetical protein
MAGLTTIKQLLELCKLIDLRGICSPPIAVVAVDDAVAV